MIIRLFFGNGHKIKLLDDGKTFVRWLGDYHKIIKGWI